MPTRPCELKVVEPVWLAPSDGYKPIRRGGKLSIQKRVNCGMNKVVTLSVILMLVGPVTCGYVVARLEGGARLAGWVAAVLVGEGGCGAGGRWQGQVVRAARLEGGARPAGPGRSSRRRAERSSRRGRRAGGQASRRTEVWRRGPHGGLAARGRTEVWRRGPAGWVAAAPVCGSGAEILMHVDRLCCYG